MLLLCEAVKPEVFAEAHLGDKLAILREMIVKMLRLQVFRRTFQITNVESNVELITSPSTSVHHNISLNEGKTPPVPDPFR